MSGLMLEHGEYYPLTWQILFQFSLINSMNISWAPTLCKTLIVLGTGDQAKQKTDHGPWPHRAHILAEGTDRPGRRDTFSWAWCLISSISFQAYGRNQVRRSLTSWKYIAIRPNKNSFYKNQIPKSWSWQSIQFPCQTQGFSQSQALNFNLVTYRCESAYSLPCSEFWVCSYIILHINISVFQTFWFMSHRMKYILHCDLVTIIYMDEYR